MGERIRRTELNQLMREYKGGAFFNYTPFMSQNFQRLAKVFVKNNSNTVIEPFDRVWVVGDYEHTIEELQTRYFVDGFVLSRVNPASSYASGVTLEPINKNSVGEIVLPGITTAWVTCTEQHRYVKVTYGRDSASFETVNSSYEADYYLIERSKDTKDGKHFTYISPHQKPDIGGHMIGYYQGGNVFSDEDCQNILQRNVACPLLRTGETIENKSMVVLSMNRLSHVWEIIEAQCPETSASSLPSGGEEEETIEGDIDNEF